jgi:hypothetical protein
MQLPVALRGAAILSWSKPDDFQVETRACSFGLYRTHADTR